MSDFKYHAELKRILEKYNVDKSDICLIGSMALSANGIRGHGDIDFCTKAAIRNLFRIGLTGNYLSENVNLVTEKYNRLIGISDDELVTNSGYHEIIDGFKVIRLELEFSAKIRRAWPKDKADIPKIEQFALKSKKWDWSLVKTDSAGNGGGVGAGGLKKKAARLFELGLKALRDPSRALEKVREKIDERWDRQIKPGPRLQSQIVTKMPTAALLGNHFMGGEFRRYDIFLRYLMVKAIDKNEGNFEKYYHEMQVLRKGRTEHQDIHSLVESIKQRGFLSRYPIPVSRDGSILDGSHRLACALYFNIDEVPVEIRQEKKQIDFGRSWFSDNGFDEGLLSAMDKTKNEIFERHGVWFSVILWPPVKEWFDEISGLIRKRFTIKYEKDINLGRAFPEFVRKIYAIDDIDRWKVERKLHAMKPYLPEVRILALEIPEPRFRVKKRTSAYLSDVGAELKKWVRNSYKEKVPDYIYDIICHTGDNYEHNRESFKIINDYVVNSGGRNRTTKR